MAANCTLTRCIPCDSLDKSHLLSKEEILSAIQDLKLWQLKENGHLSFTYVARNFQSALNSINAIGVIAEREGHHPDIHLTGYRNVKIVLYTHSLGGVTRNDLVLAKMIGDVEIDYSPKWRKENIGES
jgi:4a-hydroxytetrahydrobiopterin dehydratase